MFGELLALAELDAHVAIAREIAGAGEHQIAHARKSAHGERVSAQLGRQAPDLREAPRDQRGARVVAEAEAVGDAGRDRHHVLESSADLDTDDVVGAVHAEPAVVERALRDLGVGRGMRGHQDRGRDALCDLAGEARAGQKRELRRGDPSGKMLARICDGNISESFSMPLMAVITGTPRGRRGAS